jgi:hypothetical protein
MGLFLNNMQLPSITYCNLYKRTCINAYLGAWWELKGHI